MREGRYRNSRDGSGSLAYSMNVIFCRQTEIYSWGFWDRISKKEKHFLPDVAEINKVTNEFRTFQNTSFTLYTTSEYRTPCWINIEHSNTATVNLLPRGANIEV
jgi:hypothetical protein